MTTQPFSTLFPLIDDPANIFYSKLKSFFISQFPSILQVKCLNRVTRLVEIHLPFTSQIWKVKIDTRKLPKYVREGIDQGKTYSAYAALIFSKTRVATLETTISGENIPVEEFLSCLTSIYRKPSFIESTERVLIEQNDNSLTILIRISNPISISSRHFQTFLNKTEYKDTYKTLYKPIIGRKIKFYSEDRDDIEQGQIVEFWQWDLYDIDSDYNETLIDSSSVDKDSNNNLIFDSCKSCGYKFMWPAMYGPSVDHPIRLTFGKEKRSSHPYDTSEPFEVTVMEYDFAPQGDPVDISFAPLTDAYFDNRGLCTNPEEWLFTHIRIGAKVYSGYSREYYKEEIALALCFLLNINFRYLYSYFTPDEVKPCILVQSSGPTTSDFGRNVSYEHSSLDNGYGYTKSEALEEMMRMYFYEPFGVQESMGVNSMPVPWVQNSLVCSYYESPFIKFRNRNVNTLEHLYNSIDGEGGDNDFLLCKFNNMGNLHKVVHDRLTALTGIRYVNNSYLFHE